MSKRRVAMTIRQNLRNTLKNNNKKIHSSLWKPGWRLWLHVIKKHYLVSSWLRELYINILQNSALILVPLISSGTSFSLFFSSFTLYFAVALQYTTVYSYLLHNLHTARAALRWGLSRTDTSVSLSQLCFFLPIDDTGTKYWHECSIYESGK